MPLLALLALQAAALPDIHLRATVTADSLTVERTGEARLEVRATPDGGSRVVAEAPNVDGGRTVRDVRITLDAQARIGSGLTASVETGGGESR